jgi:hypothetical protein
MYSSATSLRIHSTGVLPLLSLALTLLRR